MHKPCYIKPSVSSNETCGLEFRFTRAEIPTVCNIVGWISGVIERKRYASDSITATCVLLRRLAYPSCWADLEVVFGMHMSQLSEVFHECAWSLYNGQHHLVTNYRNDLMQERAQNYASYVQEKGGYLSRCVGFIDGTKIKLNRPGKGNLLQRACRSRHKHIHCITFQTVTTLDRLIFRICGPLAGRQPDKYLYSKSGLDDILKNIMVIH